MAARAKAKPQATDAVEAADAPLAQRILHAAFCAFMERGYAGTSTLEIATRAKVSKRELYALFGSKEEMLAACIESRARHMRFDLDLPPATSAAMLEQMLRAFGARLLREATRPEVIAVQRLAIAEADRSPEIARTLGEVAREPNRRSLAAVLARAQSAGHLGPGEPGELAAEFLALLWRDLPIRLLLRTAAPPSEAEAEARARSAAAALLTLHPAERRR